MELLLKHMYTFPLELDLRLEEKDSSVKLSEVRNIIAVIVAVNKVSARCSVL